MAREIAELPGVQLAGIMGYEGHLLALPDPEEKARQIHEALETVVETKRAAGTAGIACDIVSSSGTGSYPIAIEHPGITEIQAGGAIFMDCFYRHKCQMPESAATL